MDHAIALNLVSAVDTYVNDERPIDGAYYW